MWKLWIAVGVVVAWLILVVFLGVIRIYTALDSTGQRLLWHEICLEIPQGADCLTHVPYSVIRVFRFLGTPYSDVTVTFKSESADPFH